MMTSSGRPDRDEVPIAGAAQVAHVSAARVRHYVRAGLVRPSRIEGRLIFFDEMGLARLRMIRRLREDLGLNLAGIEVALRLLEEIRHLRAALEEGHQIDGGSRWRST
jgi:MerR family transcriptional regulator/heat shock protein HspR